MGLGHKPYQLFFVLLRSTEYCCEPKHNVQPVSIHLLVTEIQTHAISGPYQSLILQSLYVLIQTFNDQTASDAINKAWLHWMIHSSAQVNIFHLEILICGVHWEDLISLR